MILTKWKQSNDNANHTMNGTQSSSNEKLFQTVLASKKISAFLPDDEVSLHYYFLMCISWI